MKSLVLACGAYDRTAALLDGRVSVEGVDLTTLTMPVEEIFFRTARYAEFDVAEMSLSSYALTLDEGRPFVAIPVFPSRAFRHHSVYVNTESGIRDPNDLVGKKVGVPEYQMTAAVWMRGILAEYHGVPVGSVRYRTGGLHSPGRSEKVEVRPPGVDLAPIPSGRTLSDMLLTGEIDALYTPRTPRPFHDGDPRIRRLWKDPRTAEIEYFRSSGIFPIMHTVVIRRDVYEADRWLARSLLKAFTEAKRIAVSGLSETAALSTSLPFGYAEAESTREIMGDDFWPYGIQANSHVVARLLRYSREQGLISREPRPEELFAHETHTGFII